MTLARGADVLVHSAMYPPAIDRLAARVPSAAALKASILAHQASAEDAGRMAQAAGVKTLVLSHLVPPDDPEVTDRMWIEAAQAHFRGPVKWARTCRLLADRERCRHAGAEGIRMTLVADVNLRAA